jgi:hypothetical protein
LNNIKNNLLEILIAFALYWVFVAPLYFFPALKSSQITYYLFLPAGIKLFSILVFQWRGLIGTALAIFLRLFFTDPAQGWVNWLIAAISVSIALYVAVEFGLKLMRVKRDLSNLHYYQIVALAVVTSIINGCVFAFALNSLGIGQLSEGLFHSSAITVLGNFAGNASIVCLLVFIFQHQPQLQKLFNKK